MVLLEPFVCFLEVLDHVHQDATIGCHLLHLAGEGEEGLGTVGEIFCRVH